MADSSRTPPPTQLPGNDLLARWTACYTPETAHLTPSEALLYSYLCYRRVLRAAPETIANVLPMGRTKIKAGLAKLERAGLAFRVRRSAGGPSKTNIYIPANLEAAFEAGELDDLMPHETGQKVTRSANQTGQKVTPNRSETDRITGQKLTPKERIDIELETGLRSGLVPSVNDVVPYAEWEPSEQARDRYREDGHTDRQISEALNAYRSRPHRTPSTKVRYHHSAFLTLLRQRQPITVAEFAESRTANAYAMEGKGDYLEAFAGFHSKPGNAKGPQHKPLAKWVDLLDGWIAEAIRRGH